jgi:endoglucanase
MRTTLRHATAAALITATTFCALSGTAVARPDGFGTPPPGPSRPLTFSISDAEVDEGGPGDSHVLSFDVVGSHAVGADVTFRAFSGNLGFEATPGDDFTPIDEIVTMPAGATVTSVEVPVTGDSQVEDDELVIVWLEDASAGTISDGTAIGRILDDDAPTIHISQETHDEGTGGTTDFVFTVSLSHASTQPVSLDLWTAPGSATTPADFSASAETIVFAAGETEATYVVTVVADALDEGDEEFAVQMGNAVGGTIVGGGGLGTILDDDLGFVAPGGRTGPGGLVAPTSGSPEVVISDLRMR